EWRIVPAPQGGEILYRFANLLTEEKDDLTDLMSHEMGKVKAEAGGDVQEAIDMSLYMAGEGRRMFGQTTPSELRDKFNMSVRQPIGVVGAITPWNFPIAIPSWKIAPALVCGNTVVFKPATDTPTLGERFVELFAEAGLPAGVLNIVHGDRQGRGREAADRRRSRDRERARQGLLLPAHGLRRRRSADARRAGGDLRADHCVDPHQGRRRGDPCLERDQVRPVVLDLHA